MKPADSPEKIIHDRSRVMFSGCWLWTGTMTDLGYGSVTTAALGPKRKMLAHRLAWLTWRGPIPEGMKVCHTCDNRACVNPDHLFLGTQADNLADMTAKGRARRHLGGRPHRLSASERRALLASGKSADEIAAETGVHRATVYRWLSNLNAQ